MKADYCRRCKKLYNRIKTPYCAQCLDEIEMQFNLIRDFMEHNPSADINTVLKETNTEEKVLLFLLREERLTISTRVNIPWESCGELIRSGKYCSKCTVKLTSDFSKADNEQKKQLNNINNSKVIEDKKNSSERGMHIHKN